VEQRPASLNTATPARLDLADLSLTMAAEKPAAEEKGEALGDITDREKQWAASCLVAGYGLQYVSEFLTRQPKEQLWLNLYSGNTVDMILFRGKLLPITSLVSFFVSPVMAGISDKIGRRPCLIIGATMYLSCQLVALSFRGIGGLVYYQIVRSLAETGMGLPNRAAFGDMFSDDKATFSSWIGIKALIIPAMKVNTNACLRACMPACTPGWQAATSICSLCSIVNTSSIVKTSMQGVINSLPRTLRLVYV